MHLQIICLATAALAASSSVSAMINIQTVSVADVGNSADPLTGFGSVNYEFNAGAYEVTNTQYTAFLNAVGSTDTHGLYSFAMDPFFGGGINQNGSSGSFTYSVESGQGNKPIGSVSFWDAARFANWLTNGQPTGAQASGTTETGVYDLGGVTNPVNDSILRDMSVFGAGGYAIASENEWYKAAYYDGAGSYFQYPTQSNSLPNGAQANYNAGDGLEPDAVADVGYSVPSFYGTFDQGGNYWEWNETISGSDRGRRGGSYRTTGFALEANERDLTDASQEFGSTGFRITQGVIPEPSTYALCIGSLALMVVWRRRLSVAQ